VTIPARFQSANAATDLVALSIEIEPTAEAGSLEHQNIRCGDRTRG